MGKEADGMILGVLKRAQKKGWPLEETVVFEFDVCIPAVREVILRVHGSIPEGEGRFTYGAVRRAEVPALTGGTTPEQEAVLSDWRKAGHYLMFGYTPEGLMRCTLEKFSDLRARCRAR